MPVNKILTDINGEEFIPYGFKYDNLTERESDIYEHVKDSTSPKDIIIKELLEEKLENKCR